MRRWPSSTLLLIALTACEAAPPPPPAADLRGPCTRLVAAPPHEWGTLLAELHDAGAAAEAPLLDALQRDPTAPGAQAATALLGRIGGTASRDFCVEQLDERTPLACEAALALGELPPGAEATLRACVNDHLRAADVRTAAACALARHGDTSTAPAFLAAIVRAGTAAGRADEPTLGIPNKARWALERYFVKRTLQQLGHTDLADELDPDAPWPNLESLAPKVRERLQTAQK